MQALTSFSKDACTTAGALTGVFLIGAIPTAYLYALFAAILALSAQQMLAPAALYVYRFHGVCTMTNTADILLAMRRLGHEEHAPTCRMVTFLSDSSVRLRGGTRTSAQQRRDDLSTGSVDTPVLTAACDGY